MFGREFLSDRTAERQADDVGLFGAGRVERRQRAGGCGRRRGVRGGENVEMRFEFGDQAPRDAGGESDAGEDQGRRTGGRGACGPRMLYGPRMHQSSSRRNIITKLN